MKFLIFSGFKLRSRWLWCHCETYRITRLRFEPQQELGLGLIPLLLSSHLLLLAGLGHGRALPSACSTQWIGFLRGRGLGQSLGRASAQGFHPLIYFSTMHWGDSPGEFWGAPIKPPLIVGQK
jgi:hypothetical protein